MLSPDELIEKYGIYWMTNDNLYRRWNSGTSEFGLRTEDIFGDNIYKFPELYMPSRAAITAREHTTYTSITGTVCICGCSLCKNLYIMCHIESGKEFAVGSSCIKKAKGHLFKKYDDWYPPVEPIKREYKKFDDYLKDLIKPKCVKCYDLLRTRNNKPHKKNITAEDYIDSHPYCYKCDDRYENNSKCIICNDKIVVGINSKVEQAKEIKWGFCSDCDCCSDSRFKFYFNISYSDKDKYKEKYNTKWDATAKKWYLITTFKGLDDDLKKIISSFVR